MKKDEYSLLTVTHNLFCNPQIHSNNLANELFQLVIKENIKGCVQFL
jgi:hypothetical protein